MFRVSDSIPFAIVGHRGGFVADCPPYAMIPSYFREDERKSADVSTLSSLESKASSNKSKQAAQGYHSFAASGSVVTIKMLQPCLVSRFVMDSKSVAEVDVWVSYDADGKSFEKMRECVKIPMRSKVTLPLGHLPCTFIKLACTRACATGLWLRRLTIVGIPRTELCTDPELDTIMYQKNVTLLAIPSESA